MEAVSTAAAIEVEDLDAAGVLARLADAERRDRAVQLEKLRLAYQWCVQHPATAETGTATWGDAGLPGLADCDASLGGDGTPGGGRVRRRTARRRAGGLHPVRDGTDGRTRWTCGTGCPGSGHWWSRSQVAPWKTRRVAEDTRSLPLAGARWVDEQLAARVDGFGPPTIERMVALAAARYAPEQQAEKERIGRTGWHVTLTHPRPGDFAGTSWLEAAGDTADLTAFHDLVCTEAQLLGRLGDTDDYQTRKAKALGVIAARQATLDLVGETPDGRRSLVGRSQTTLLPAPLGGRPGHPPRRPATRSSVRPSGSARSPST